MNGLPECLHEIGMFTSVKESLVMSPYIRHKLFDVSLFLDKPEMLELFYP